MPFLMMLYKMKAILLHFLSSFADFVFSLYNHQVGKKDNFTSTLLGSWLNSSHTYPNNNNNKKTA